MVTYSQVEVMNSIVELYPRKKWETGSNFLLSLSIEFGRHPIGQDMRVR
jgi:hypothetical protein